MKDFSSLNIVDKDELLQKVLTKTQYKVAKMIIEKKSNREITQALDVRPITTSFHIGNVYKTLGIKNWQELLAWYTGEQTLPNQTYTARQKVQSLQITKDMFIEKAKGYRTFSEMPTIFRDWIIKNGKENLAKKCFSSYKPRTFTNTRRPKKRSKFVYLETPNNVILPVGRKVS